VRLWIFAALVFCSLQQAWSSTAAHSAEALNRDTRNCRAHSISACYDAVRWNPSDPALQVSLGDALMAARRPADALRAYHRASTMAPNTPGVAAKIAAAERKRSTRRVASVQPARTAAIAKASTPGFSNAAPEAQSH
jgi:cytochrome c-type biogenesis protein CcmH/NrfG